MRLAAVSLKGQQRLTLFEPLFVLLFNRRNGVNHLLQMCQHGLFRGVGVTFGDRLIDFFVLADQAFRR